MSVACVTLDKDKCQLLSVCGKGHDPRAGWMCRGQSPIPESGWFSPQLSIVSTWTKQLLLTPVHLCFRNVPTTVILREDPLSSPSLWIPRVSIYECITESVQSHIIKVISLIQGRQTGVKLLKWPSLIEVSWGLRHFCSVRKWICLASVWLIEVYFAAFLYESEELFSCCLEQNKKSLEKKRP